MVSLNGGDEEFTRSKLVHQLQRERGVTCGMVGSGGSRHFAELVAIHRGQTNGMEGCSKLALLPAIREAADASLVGDGGAAADARAAASFFDVFSRFNALIKSLLDNGQHTSEISHAFAQLKEATGIERAFLCGALALPATALDHLPSRAFAELVIGLQQQRTHESVIRDTAPPKLLELIRAGFEYAPELRDVQVALLADFDVARLRERLSASDCWRMLTEHIDKLERLQVLLHDELEKARQGESVAQGAVRETIRVLKESDEDEAAIAHAATQLASCPSDLLKKELARLLKEAATTARAGAVEAERRRLSKEEPPEGGADNDGLAALMQAVPSELRIALEDLAFTRRIGSGAAGVTYLAKYQGGTVAVKLAGGGGGVDDWQREVRAFARLRHTNIVRFIGAICAPPSVGLVIEYCDHGDVSSAITRNAAPNLPPGFVLHVAGGVDAGMLHLHERSLLHRDLKGANVLLDGAWVVKISDFGLTVRAPEDTRAGGWLTAETGTYRFMAPEVVCHERYSKSADVFSYACLLFELLTHEQPFADRSPLQAAVAVGLNHARPPLPAGLPHALARLVQACWCHEPTDRPTFEQIGTQLDALAAVLTRADLAWLDAPGAHPVYAPMPDDHASSTSTRNWLQASAGWLSAALVWPKTQEGLCVAVRK